MTPSQDQEKAEAVRVLQATVEGQRRVPHMPLEDVLATQGDRPHKRRLHTQEPVRDVLKLCEARAHQGRAPRRNTADSA